METTLYKITFKDGRIFKIFCANKKQKQRLLRVHTGLHEQEALLEILENGIHNIKQFEDYLNIKTN